MDPVLAVLMAFMAFVLCLTLVIICALYFHQKEVAKMATAALTEFGSAALKTLVEVSEQAASCPRPLPLDADTGCEPVGTGGPGTGE